MTDEPRHEWITDSAQARARERLGIVIVRPPSPTPPPGRPVRHYVPPCDFARRDQVRPFGRVALSAVIDAAPVPILPRRWKMPTWGWIVLGYVAVLVAASC